MIDDKHELLLRMGDTTLVLSQRLSEWCGKGPALEEDMALANVALDLIGQSRMWLSYAAEVEGAGRDEDSLAFLRDAHQFRNMLLVEQPNGNYACTLVRQFYFDTWHQLALEALTRSADGRIAAIAEKALKEVLYHLRRSGDLVVRLGDGTPESRRLVQEAVDDLWMFTGELFATDDVDQVMSAQSIVAEPASLRQPWLAHVKQVLEDATIKMPSPGAWMQAGGKQGRHTEALGYLLAELQVLQRTYPAAQW